MRVESIGGLEASIVNAREDGDRESDDRLIVVLLHGYGAPGEDLIPLSSGLAHDRVSFVFPKAPHTLPMLYPGARAWWPIDMERLQRALYENRLEQLADEHPKGLDEAREALESFLHALPGALKAPRTSVVLGGFSQGAMLSCDFALRTSHPLSGLVLLSGSLLDKNEWLPKMAARKGLPVFQSHGTSDPILPYALAERLRASLLDAGLDVHWSSFRGGHGIPGSVQDDLRTFLHRLAPR